MAAPEYSYLESSELERLLALHLEGVNYAILHHLQGEIPLLEAHPFLPRELLNKIEDKADITSRYLILAQELPKAVSEYLVKQRCEVLGIFFSSAIEESSEDLLKISQVGHLIGKEMYRFISCVFEKHRARERGDEAGVKTFSELQRQFDDRAFYELRLELRYLERLLLGQTRPRPNQE